MIPHFNGESAVTVDQYIYGCKKASRSLYSRMSEDQSILIFQNKVCGKASDLIVYRSFDRLQSYYSGLIETYSNVRNDLHVCGELQSIVQQDNKSIHIYISRGMRFLDYHVQLMDGFINDVQKKSNVENQITKCFVRGLQTLIRLGVEEENNIELASKQAIAEETGEKKIFLEINFEELQRESI